MKYNYTPIKATTFLSVLAAAIFLLTSSYSFAAAPNANLQLASLNKNTPAPVADPAELLAAGLSGDLRTVQRLVRERVNVNHMNSDRETALHMAASRGHLSVVIFLVSNGANINARTQNNWIPLHHAVRFNRPQVANYLMAKGAPAHFKTGDGLDSFDIAVNMSNARMINLVQRYMNR